MIDVKELTAKINELAEGMRPTTVMEVCGTHTHAIMKYGIRQLLPRNIRLVSGPGCPVCVTSQADIARALTVASRKNVIFMCFGDMMRVPCGKKSLLSLRDSGADVRIADSPMAALRVARENPSRDVIWYGVGFETTAPATAAAADAALQTGVRNFSILSAHKTMPAALRALLGKGSRVDALLCPGHVATIIGSDAFRFVADELKKPAVIAGFGAQEILAALAIITAMIKKGEVRCVNAYPTAVTVSGNEAAMKLLLRVFEPCDAQWRGLGVIPESGLALKGEYKALDTATRFDLFDNIHVPDDDRGCICAAVLRGDAEPENCPNFGVACTPTTPLGPCMVSGEGSCAAAYAYGGSRV